MILHLAYDEKVINRCIDNFEAVYPDENKFVILLKDESQPKLATHPKAISCKYNSKEFWETIGDVSQYKSIVLHLLSEESADFVSKVCHPNIYWIEWGGDLYNQLLQVRGFKIYYDKDISWKMSHVRLPHFLYNIVKTTSLKLNAKKIVKAAKKIKYFVPDSMYDEVEIIKQYYPELSHLQYKNFFYYPIDEVVQPELYNKQVEGNNIIIGNSASTSGNHEMVFNKIKGLGIPDSKIICPLSYGNHKYAEYVNYLGSSIWGRKFDGLMTFMPLDEYNKIFLSANTFIYGNWRQEAVGNILVSLFLGGRVILDIRNPLYSYYQRCGLIIFPLHAVDETNIGVRLSDDEIKHNRSILIDMYSKEKLFDLIKNNFLC